MEAGTFSLVFSFFCAEDLRKGDENNGVLHTCDIAVRDSDGFYSITGRKKRFVKMQGKRVNLDEIERLVRENFANGDFAAVGSDDKITIFTDGDAAEDDVLELLFKITGIKGKDVRSVHIGEIPENEAGKPLYKEPERVSAEL